jgi:hypothetical protein
VEPIAVTPVRPGVPLDIERENGPMYRLTEPRNPGHRLPTPMLVAVPFVRAQFNPLLATLGRLELIRIS